MNNNSNMKNINKILKSNSNSSWGVFSNTNSCLTKREKNNGWNNEGLDLHQLLCQ